MPTEETKEMSQISEDELMAHLEKLESLAKGTFEMDLKKGGDADPDDDGDENEDNDGDGDGVDPDEQEDEEEEEAEKSLSGDDTIRKAIEVSEFLDALVTRTEEAIQGFSKRIGKIEKSMASAQSETREMVFEIAKSFGTVAEELQKAFSGVEDLKKSFDSAPAHPRKSQMRILEKSFGGEGAGETKLSKSQIASKLTDLAMDGNSGVKAGDVVRFETDGFIRPEVMQRIMQ